MLLGVRSEVGTDHRGLFLRGRPRGSGEKRTAAQKKRSMAGGRAGALTQAGVSRLCPIYPRAGVTPAVTGGAVLPSRHMATGRMPCTLGLCFRQSVSFAFNFNTLCAMKDSE